jgi:predicted transposase YdaD
MADLLDRSLKVLLRRATAAFLRLAGVSVDPVRIHLSDVTINLPEHRADQVPIIGAVGDADRSAIHLECQTQPNPRVLVNCFLKTAALTAQLQVPVVLVVLYLLRGDRATFPDTYHPVAGGLSNDWRFHTIRLWEHADRIRSGELAELAPLLLLCEDRPSEQTLEEERALIRSLNAPPDVEADLLAVAAMIGTRYFSGDELKRLFREELTMLKEAGFIQEWIEEGIEEGIAKGLAQGRAQGRAEGYREVLLEQLRVRFGELPADAVAHIQQADAERCRELAIRLLTVSSLAELGLNGSPVPDEPSTS